jgi:hypothetical protein
MKTFRTIGATILILIIGVCAIAFAGYKVFLDKPGFFRQFDDEEAVREYLVNNLAINEDSRDYTIECIHQHLSDDEGCISLRDATADSLHCLVANCPPVTDETTNTVLHCFVRAYDVFLEYKISLFFEHDKLIDIKVEPSGGLP